MCFAKDHPRASDSLAEDGSVRSDSIDLCFYTPHLDEKVGVGSYAVSVAGWLLEGWADSNYSHSSFCSRPGCVQCQ
jgi:hypothetical protein